MFFESLNNATKNGYELDDWNEKEIAEDISEYDAQFENIEISELIPFIREWKLSRIKSVCDGYRHLIAEPYSIENLHLLAEKLKIKRGWFHQHPYPHYDIPKRKVDEVKAVSIVVTSKEVVRRCQNYWKRDVKLPFQNCKS